MTLPTPLCEAGFWDKFQNDANLLTKPSYFFTLATIVFVRRADGLGDWLAIVAGIVAVHVVLYLALRFATVILRVIREGGVLLVTRISGLLLSAIAVQLIANSAIAFSRQA